MKLIVIDLDREKWLTLADRKRLNERKITTLTIKDFGKKTLLGLPKNDPTCLRAHLDYEDAIFTLKTDDEQLKHENKMFRDLLREKRIKWFRVGVILRREKAIKILQRMLGVA